MPQVHVLPAAAEHIPALSALEASYTTDTVWRMDAPCGEIPGSGALFRAMRLPRSTRVAYPRDLPSLLENWMHFEALLVATLHGQPVGFVLLRSGAAPSTAWVSDIVVGRPWRRQGIGTALLLAAHQWGRHMHRSRLTMEMQPRNFPAIRLAEKLGLAFAGYHEHYYAPQETALFFSRSL